MKFIKNLSDVAHTATKADTGTAYVMFISKKINMMGMLLPAPLRPPAFDNEIKTNIRKYPKICFPLWSSKLANYPVSSVSAFSFREMAAVATIKTLTILDIFIYSK